MIVSNVSDDLQSCPTHLTRVLRVIYESYDFERHASNMTLCQTFHFYPLVSILLFWVYNVNVTCLIDIVVLVSIRVSHTEWA